jgi:hypothetical protein
VTAGWAASDGQGATSRAQGVAWKKRLAVLLLVGLMAADAGLGRWKERLLPPTPGVSLASAALEVLGELRTFLARTLWFKADAYHHVMEAQGIPWTQERDVMALYRVITILDPRFEEAYDIASFQLVMNFGRQQEGLDFLAQGLVHNPDSFALSFGKAFLEQHLAQELQPKRQRTAAPPRAGLPANPEDSQRQPSPAERDHLLKARAAAEHAWQLVRQELGQVVRDLQAQPTPELATKRDELVVRDGNTLRILAHVSRDLGDVAAEMRYLREWLGQFPRDPYARPRLSALEALVGQSSRERPTATP